MASASLTLTLATLGVVGGAHPDSTSRVSWNPERPVEGTIMEIVVAATLGSSRPTGALAIRGSLAGQVLHFEADTAGDFRALVAIPVGATRTRTLVYSLTDEYGIVEQAVNDIPVRRGRFSTTQLTVDPRFVSPPDSALAARIAIERAAVNRVSVRSYETPRLWNPPFMRPRTTRITSPFGQRREFNGELRSRHWGVDVAGSRGEPVRTANRGIVVLAQEFYYAGNAVYIDHGRGVLTAYMHLSEILVAVGDTVEQGQAIGRVGATGRVTGPHLHWQAKYGTVTFNPLSLVELDLSRWKQANR